MNVCRGGSSARKRHMLVVQQYSLVALSRANRDSELTLLRFAVAICKTLPQLLILQDLYPTFMAGCSPPARMKDIQPCRTFTLTHYASGRQNAAPTYAYLRFGSSIAVRSTRLQECQSKYGPGSVLRSGATCSWPTMAVIGQISQRAVRSGHRAAY